MNIKAIENQIILTDVFSGVTIETAKGKQLHVCLRDNGFDVSLNNGEFWHISEQSDAKQDKPKTHSKQRVSADKNAELCCPTCKSTNLSDKSLRESNGVFGPGHHSAVKLKMTMCNECGNLFRELGND